VLFYCPPLVRAGARLYEECMQESLDLLDQWLEQKQLKDPGFRPGAKPVLITTVSSAEPFEPNCLRGLAILEEAMLENGQDAGAFSIMKYNVGAGASYPGAADTNIHFYGYKIIFNDDSYRIRRKGDMDLLAYFSTLILGDDEEEAQKKPSLLGKVAGWFKGKAV